MKQRTNLAFTLHELLTTLALICIGLSMALPAYSALKQKSEQEAVRNQLHASLNYARLQAILQRTTVELCGTANGLTCDNNWGQGWRVHLRKTPEQAMQIQQLSFTTQLRWAGFDKRIRFHTNGTSPTSNGRFFQCQSESVAWQLIINRQGRVRHASHIENLAEAYRCRQQNPK